MKHLKVALLVSFITAAAFAQDYIVLFKQNEVSISSMEHGAYQNVLQTSNQKSLEQLQTWMGSRGFSAAPTNLWLIRGAKVTLNEEGAKKLAKEAWVESVRPDQLRKFISPRANLQVANTLGELGDEPESLWGLQNMGVDKIRKDYPKLTGKGVRVGVIDTGIQSRHYEFSRATVVFKDFVQGKTEAYDDHGHGTHVSGTIAGTQVGVAPEATILFAKGLNAIGSGYDSTLLGAMQWMFDPDGNSATDDFPRVVSCSWGGDLYNRVNDMAEFSEYVLAINAYVRGGIIPVFAAGNSGSAPNGFPGGLPDAIAVGAIDSGNQVAEFSSRGPNIWKIGSSVISLLKPDVSAPGVKVSSAFPGNKYATWEGTSMATPHVAGAVALLLQAAPKLNFADVKTLLLASSTKKIDISYGYGIVNAHKMIKMALARE